MPYKFNVFTGNFDLAEDENKYIRKDQDDTTAYSVTVDKIYLGGSTDTYFKLNGTNTLEVYVAGQLQEQFITGTVQEGNPYGLLLSLTCS